MSLTYSELSALATKNDLREIPQTDLMRNGKIAGFCGRKSDCREFSGICIEKLPDGNSWVREPLPDSSYTGCIAFVVQVSEQRDIQW